MLRRYRTLFLAAALVILAGCAHLPQKPEDRDSQAERELYDDVSELMKQDNIDEAIQRVEKRLKEFPPDQPTPELTDLRILHARLLLQSGKLGHALEILTALLDENPSHTEALFLLSVLRGSEGDESGQKKLLEQVLELDPGHVDALTSSGSLYLASGDLTKAEESYAQALEKDNESFLALVGLGQVSIKRKRYPTAERYFDRAIAIATDFPYVYVDRAVCRKARGDFEGAAEDLARAITLDPGSYWHYIDRGKIFLLMGRRIAAEQDFLQAAEIDGKHFLAYVYLAGICYEDGRWSEALRYYTQLVALKGDYHFAYEPLGVLNYGFGNWEESIRYFAKAHAHHPTETAYLLLTALSLKRQGKTVAAAEYLRGNLNKISPEDWRYDVARYLIRPEHVSPVLARMNREKNPDEKKRMSFYIASQYLISGQTRAAKAILVDLTANLHSRHIESILTQWELNKLEKGS